MATSFRTGDTVIAARHAGWHEIKGTIEAVLDNGLVRVQWTGGEAAHELDPSDWFSFDRLEAYEEGLDVIEEPTSAFSAGSDIIFA